MNTTTTKINSIEEYTLFALDRSIEGLDTLKDDCRRCSDAIDQKADDAMSQLSALAVNIHDFDIFQNDICSFFFVEPDSISDASGTLKSAMDDFRETLNMMTAKLNDYDVTGLSGILRFDLPSQLNRFKDLLPIIREHIHAEYLQPAAKC